MPQIIPCQNATSSWFIISGLPCSVHNVLNFLLHQSFGLLIIFFNFIKNFNSFALQFILISYSPTGYIKLFSWASFSSFVNRSTNNNFTYLMWKEINYGKLIIKFSPYKSHGSLLLNVLAKTSSCLVLHPSSAPN